MSEMLESQACAAEMEPHIHENKQQGRRPRLWRGLLFRSVGNGSLAQRWCWDNYPDRENGIVSHSVSYNRQKKKNLKLGTEPRV